MGLGLNLDVAATYPQGVETNGLVQRDLMPYLDQGATAIISRAPRPSSRGR